MTGFKKLPITKETTKFLIFSLTFTIIFIFSFIKFADELIEHELKHFDRAIIGWIQSGITPDMTELMKLFTFFGSTTAIVAGVVIVSVIMFFCKHKWEPLFLMASSGLGALFNPLLKWLFQRQRPDVHRLIEETGYSFPSGHSMGSFIFYGMLAYFLFFFFKSRIMKTINVIFLFFFIMMIGTSRIYLGVHYPSDVLAGFAAGGAWLTICIASYKISVDVKEKKGESQRSK